MMLSAHLTRLSFSTLQAHGTRLGFPLDGQRDFIPALRTTSM